MSSLPTPVSTSHIDPSTIVGLKGTTGQRDEVSIVPVNGPLGATITGLDLSEPLVPETILELKRAWADHLVLIFKNQTLTDREFIDFAGYFGNIFYPPEDIPVLASAADGKVPAIIPVANVDGGYTGSGELQPHSDHHWTPHPSKGSFLYALEVPATGGDTHWSNLYRVYDELPESTKKRIDGLRLITYNPFKRKPGEYRPSYRDFNQAPPSEAFPHPLVGTHPETGRKFLYLDYATEVEVPELDPSEGSALIAELREHLNQPRFYYRHHWSVGDIVLWDNLATLHYRPAFDASSRRILKRISLAGRRPF